MKLSLNIFTAFLFFIFLICSVVPAGVQNSPDDRPHILPRATPTPTPAAAPTPGPNEATPQSEPYRPPFPGDEPGAEQPGAAAAGESSSKDSQIDLDARPVLAEPLGPDKDESVFLPFDPHRAALDRFHDALLYKPNDAEAMYGLGVTQEKLDLLDQADQSYRKYLQILPNGPKSSEAQDALKR